MLGIRYSPFSKLFYGIGWSALAGVFRPRVLFSAVCSHILRVPAYVLAGFWCKVAKEPIVMYR